MFHSSPPPSTIATTNRWTFAEGWPFLGLPASRPMHVRKGPGSRPAQQPKGSLDAGTGRAKQSIGLDHRTSDREPLGERWSE